MEEHVNRAGDSLFLEDLLPVGSEGENTVGVAVQDVEKELRLHRVDLIAVDPDLEVPLNPGLANLL